MADASSSADDAHGHDDHSSPEYVKQQVKRFVFVLGSLFALTVVTVLAAYIPDSWVGGEEGNIVIALAIATIKAALVALIFMHLISEQLHIYRPLAFTAIFAFGLVFLTLFAVFDEIERKELEGNDPAHKYLNVENVEASEPSVPHDNANH